MIFTTPLKTAVFIFIFLPLSLFSQDVLWEKSLGGKHAEFLYDALPTPDYGYILVGSSLSNKNGNKEDKNKGDLDFWLWKMDERGNQEWQKSFGGNKVDLLQSLSLTIDGGYILAGTSSSDKGFDKKDDCKGQEDFWIIKLDAKGGEEWQKTIGGNGAEKLLSVIQTNDGGYILGGTSSSDKAEPNEKGKVDEYNKSENSRGNLDFWIVKLNSTGKIEWQKTIGGKYNDILKCLIQVKEGGYLLGGYSNSPYSGDKTANNFGQGDFWIVKITDRGEIEWQKVLGGNKDDNLFSLIQTKDGGLLIGGNSNSDATDTKSKSNKNGTDFWVIKMNENGNIEWQEIYDYGKNDVLTSIIENRDGTFLIGGYAASESKSKKKGNPSKLDDEGVNDYIALKINSKGEEIWTKIIGSKGDEILRKLFETRDGGYLLAGTSNGKISRDKNTSKGGNDFWIVKLKDKNKPNQEKVTVEAFPNPAINYTNLVINYDYTYGTATLYDLNGRMIKSEKMNGSRTIPIDLSALPQGIYLVYIDTNIQKDELKIMKN